MSTVACLPLPRKCLQRPPIPREPTHSFDCPNWTIEYRLSRSVVFAMLLTRFKLHVLLSKQWTANRQAVVPWILESTALHGQWDDVSMG